MTSTDAEVLLNFSREMKSDRYRISDPWSFFFLNPRGEPKVMRNDNTSAVLLLIVLLGRAHIATSQAEGGGGASSMEPLVVNAGYVANFKCVACQESESNSASD